MGLRGLVNQKKKKKLPTVIKREKNHKIIKFKLLFELSI